MAHGTRLAAMWSCETFFSPETYLTRVVLRYRLNNILKTILWPITTVLVENSIYSAHFLHSVLIIPRFPPVKLMSLKFIQTLKSKHLFCATSSWKKNRIIRINEQVGNKNLQLIEVTPHQVNTTEWSSNQQTALCLFDFISFRNDLRDPRYLNFA